MGARKVASEHNRELHIWTCSGCNHIHKICTSPTQTKSQHGEGSGHGVPPLVTELLTVVRCCTERKDRSSLRCVAPKKSTLFQEKAIYPRIFGERHMYTQSWVGREGGKGLYLQRYRRGKVNLSKCSLQNSQRLIIRKYINFKNKIFAPLKKLMIKFTGFTSLPFQEKH